MRTSKTTKQKLDIWNIQSLDIHMEADTVRKGSLRPNNMVEKRMKLYKNMKYVRDDLKIKSNLVGAGLVFARLWNITFDFELAGFNILSLVSLVVGEFFSCFCVCARL